MLCLARRGRLRVKKLISDLFSVKIKSFIKSGYFQEKWIFSRKMDIFKKNGYFQEKWIFSRKMDIFNKS